jgi:hypothetical protein
VTEVIGDGSRKVANQPEQHLRGSIGRSNRGIISAMRCSRVVEKMNGIRSVVDLEDLLPFYLALNAAKYHNLNPHRRPLRAYLGHPHGHQDVAVVPLHSFLHDDERVIFVNRVPHGCRIVGRFGILLVKLNALKLVEHPLLIKLILFYEQLICCSNVWCLYAYGSELCIAEPRKGTICSK